MIGILADNLRLRGSRAAASGAARDPLGARARPAARRRDRPLHRPDVPADPVHRRARRPRAAARRLAARALQRAGAPRQPARQRRGARGAPVGGRARRVRPRPANVAKLLRRRASSSATCTRTTSTRARSRTTSAPTRSSRRTRDGSHELPRARRASEVITIDPHTTTMLRTRLPDARRGLRRRGAQLPRGARRAAGCRADRSLSGEVVLHDSCVYARYENVVARAARAARRDRPHRRRAGARREADLVLRRPGRGALPREGGSRRRQARRAAGRGRAATA